MKKILISTNGPVDWKRLLAKPDLHWKKGRSAMTTALCWEAAESELPAEISRLLDATNILALTKLDLVLAVPEWQTQLPGGERPSCTDVMALARNDAGLVAIAVEAKVDEPFGPTVGEKRKAASIGQKARLLYLESVLQVDRAFDDGVRYQLLHRTASALLAARQFHAATAVMLIHSFSPSLRWKEDFEIFCTAMGAEGISNNVYCLKNSSQPTLYLAWCAGDLKFLEFEAPLK